MDHFRICWLVIGRNLSWLAVHEWSTDEPCPHAQDLRTTQELFSAWRNTPHQSCAIFRPWRMFEICPSSMCIICSFIRCNGGEMRILVAIRGKNVDPVLLLSTLIGGTTTCRDCHCWLWVRSVRPMVSQRDLPNWSTASQCRAKKITTDVLLSRFAPYYIILTPFLELLNILSAFMLRHA